MNNFLLKLLGEVKLNPNRVAEVLQLAVRDDLTALMRVYAYISDSEDMPVIAAKHITDGEELDLVSYNFLTDMVAFKGIKAQTRYFATPEEAAAVTEIYPNSYNLPGKYNKDSTNCVPGKVWYSVEDSMPRERW